MPRTAKRHKEGLGVAKGTGGRFGDVLPVHTAPSGTQYVLPIDFMLTDDEIQAIVESVRERIRAEKGSAGSPF